MDALFSNMPLLALCLSIGLLGGIIKGMVGFALPTILMSGLGSLVAPELALAGLILPAFVSNGIQALQQGPRAAMASVTRFRVFLLAGLAAMLFSSQMVAVLPVEVLLFAIGAPITVFSVVQLKGWQPRMTPSRRVEVGVGSFAGLIGGMSGIWGPPTVAYLTALGTEKSDQIRVQGVIYGLGALALMGAHIGSGILNAQTIWFSALMVVPAVLGMWIGGLFHDRIDQAAFRKATLIVLLVAGLNLLRRALL